MPHGSMESNSTPCDAQHVQVACEAGAWDIARMLVEKKANIKAVGKDQWTPLRECW